MYVCSAVVPTTRPQTLSPSLARSLIFSVPFGIDPYDPTLFVFHSWPDMSRNVASHNLHSSNVSVLMRARVCVYVCVLSARISVCMLVFDWESFACLLAGLSVDLSVGRSVGWSVSRLSGRTHWARAIRRGKRQTTVNRHSVYRFSNNWGIRPIPSCPLCAVTCLALNSID